MALNEGTIIDIAFDAVRGASDIAMTAYSAFTLLFTLNRSSDLKQLRRDLKTQAMLTGKIAENTWESYVKAIDVAAAKLHANLETDADYKGIFDMPEAEAVDAVRQLYEGLNVVSGGDIRLWSKAEGFEPLDKVAIKAAEAEAKRAKALADGQVALAKRRATNHADSATLPDAGKVVPVSTLDAILAAIAAIGTEADALKAMAALNDRMLALAPAPVGKVAVAPVLADDKAPDAASTLAAHFNRKAA